MPKMTAWIQLGLDTGRKHRRVAGGSILSVYLGNLWKVSVCQEELLPCLPFLWSIEHLAPYWHVYQSQCQPPDSPGPYKHVLVMHPKVHTSLLPVLTFSTPPALCQLSGHSRLQLTSCSVIMTRLPHPWGAQSFSLLPSLLLFSLFPQVALVMSSLLFILFSLYSGPFKLPLNVLLFLPTILKPFPSNHGVTVCVVSSL